MQQIAKAKNRLNQFYSSLFNYSAEDQRSIRQYINHDVSILILARKRKEGEKQPRNLLELTEGDVVVGGAVTFVSARRQDHFDCFAGIYPLAGHRCSRDTCTNCINWLSEKWLWAISVDTCD